MQPRESTTVRPPQPERRCFRVSAAATDESRRRGSRLGLAHRYALRNLPPIEQDLLPEEEP